MNGVDGGGGGAWVVVCSCALEGEEVAVILVLELGEAAVGGVVAVAMGVGRGGWECVLLGEGRRSKSQLPGKGVEAMKV